MPTSRSFPAVGVHHLDADTYHADPCTTPSLSASIAHLLCTSSPKHAWTAHPRLNPAYRRDEHEHFDIGTTAHAILLEGGADRVEVLEFDDWRKKAAQDARALVRASGRIPILAKHWDAVAAMVEAAREQLAALDVDPAPFTDGKPEQALVWEDEGGVLCRARLDWLRDDQMAIDDYKTSGRTANPERFSRILFDHGYDVQAAFYRRGLRILTGASPAWRWIVQETQPPYALSVVAPKQDVEAIGDRKVAHALRVWRECLERDEWPAYPTRVCWVEVPAYEETRWLEKEAREEMAV